VLLAVLTDEVAGLIELTVSRVLNWLDRIVILIDPSRGSAEAASALFFKPVLLKEREEFCQQPKGRLRIFVSYEGSDLGARHRVSPGRMGP
jgi:hypothetical protein